MKLFLINNVSRDPQYANRRRANPLYVTKIPSINGHRLYPRTTIQVSEDELSETEISSINNFIKAGVVTVSILGGDIHIEAIPIDSVEEEVQAPEIQAPEVLISEDEETLSVEEEPPEEPIEEPAPLVEEEPDIPEEPAPVEIAEIVEENEEDSSNYTESDLVKMKNSELRELLSIIDPDFASAGIKKSILVERILEKQ